MTDSFGTPTEDTSGQGKNFGDNTDTGTTGDQGTQGIDSEAYKALQNRDEAAQLHIPKLESENDALRDEVVKLQDKLASATTIDEALDKMSNQGNDQSLDRTDVAQIVTEALGTQQTNMKQEANWTSVQAKLTSVYGDWNTADGKVQERCAELDISLQEATDMARRNPKAFDRLFVPSETSESARSGGTGEMGQRGADTRSDTARHDEEYYTKLRRTDPEKYWNIETQAQYRRDCHKQS